MGWVGGTTVWLVSGLTIQRFNDLPVAATTDYRAVNTA